MTILIDLLQTLPTPIIPHEDTQRQTSYYTYQVGEQTEHHPFGVAPIATPDFLDVMRFSLEAAILMIAFPSESKYCQLPCKGKSYTLPTSW